MEGKKKVIFLTIGIAVIVTVFLPGYLELRKIKEENRQHKKRIEILEGENKGLSEEIRKMQNEPGYIERTAREKLGIVKKGELVYREAE